MKLKPFDPKSKCPKCGHGKVRTTHEGPIEQDPGWYARKYNPPNKWPEHEFLRRGCEQCGYEWPEAVRASH